MQGENNLIYENPLSEQEQYNHSIEISPTVKPE